MKYIMVLIFIFLLQGCLYFNDRGVSAHLYDNCHSYYDENGDFIETCDENIIDYDEAKEGGIAIKDKIVQDLDNITVHQDKDAVTDIESPSEQDIDTLIENDPLQIKDIIESSHCP